MLGYSADEMMGKHLFSFMDGDGLKIAARNVERRKQGIAEQHDFEFMRKDGNRIIVTIATAPIIDEDGNYAGAIAGVIDITERKRIENELQTQRNLFENIIENIPATIDWRDKNQVYLGANRYHINLFGQGNPDNIIGRSYLSNSVFEKEQLAILEMDRKVLETGESILNYEFKMTLPDGREWIALNSKVALKNENADIIGVLTIGVDIRTLKQTEKSLQDSLKEKEFLLQEIYHRVKNNMQVIASLLNLQKSRIEDANAKAALEESQKRVQSMALVHELLYQSESLSNIDLGEYIASLAGGLLDTGNVKFILDAKGISVGIDQAIPCGLVINELVSNSIKHAFSNDQPGEITIKALL